MLESTLQKAVVKYLDIMQLDYKYKDKFFFYHPANESNARMSVGWHAKRKAEGLKAGVSDLVILFKNGKCIFIELKVDRSSLKTAINDGSSMLSENQRHFKSAVESLNFEFHIICARSVCDCIDSMQTILNLYIK